MSPSEPKSLSVELLRQIDHICDRFEAALQAEAEPNVDEYLKRVPHAARDVLRKELAALVQNRRQIHDGKGPRSILLRMTSPDAPAKSRSFGEGEALVMGRSPHAHWVLEDPQVDALHCCLTVGAQGGRVIDLGSKSGTWVNGTRQREAELSLGDRFRVGTTTFEFQLAASSGTEHTEAYQKVKSLPRGTHSQETEPAPVIGSDSTSRSHSKPLTAIPGYTIEREIGRGGMGVVFQATHKATARPTALKVIIPPKSANDKALQLFLREASTLSQLKHERIVQFCELGMSGGQMFLAMEYVNALDLQAILQQPRDPANVRAFCAITCQVLEALEYAHGLGVVHRDVKLSNVLVTREGKTLCTKLTDFGLAKNFQNAGLSEMTEEGEARGTLAYMPPEQLEDARYAKPPADIYATGVLLYYVLSGVFPFEPTDGRDVITRILHDEPIPLKSRCPDLPDALAEIVHNAMAKKPRNRFQTAAEMRQALLPFARKATSRHRGAHVAILPRPPLPWYQATFETIRDWIDSKIRNRPN